MAIAEEKSLALGLLRYQQQVKGYVPDARCRLSRDGLRYEIIDPNKGKEVNINLWGIDGKTRLGEAIAGVPFGIREPGGLVEYRAWQAAARKLSGEWGTLTDPWTFADIAATILEHAVVLSQSTPGKSYELLRTPSGWQHTSTDCMAWVTLNDCNHVRRTMTTEQIESTALATISGDVLARIEELEDAAIVEALTGSVTAAWAYSFPVSGKQINGLSSKGVEEAGREMAKMGEALREIDVRVDYEDETEARFIAKAGRYAISGNGAETMLDSAIRGKRQPKYMTANGRKVFDENWYEKGVTKANRNAKDALIPNTIRAHIIAEAAKAGRVQQVQERPQAQPAQRAAVRPPAPRAPERTTVDLRGTQTTAATAEELPGIKSNVPQRQTMSPSAGSDDLSTRFWTIAKARGTAFYEPILKQFGSTSFEALDLDGQQKVVVLLEEAAK